MAKGTLYWVTGLSGAGKTTIGTRLYEYLKTKKENVCFFDGDVLREIYQSQAYDVEARKYMAYCHGRLCKHLTEQNVDVVSSVIAMFEECRMWNRENIDSYKEIYLQVPMQELIRRDQKQLYSRALKKEITNVMGIDIPFEAPQHPDLIIDNSGIETPDEVVERIIRELKI